MVRKKSVLSKVKKRKKAYRRRQEVRPHVSRSWRTLILVIKAVKKFLNFRHNVESVSFSSRTLDRSKVDEILSNYGSSLNNTQLQVKCHDLIEVNGTLNDLAIIQDIIKKLTSNVCRLDSERKRQLQIRQNKKTSKAVLNNKKVERTINYFRDKYHNNIHFRENQKTRIKKKNSFKYRNDKKYREEVKAKKKKHIFNKYHSNTQFRERFKSKSKFHILTKYHTNSNFRDQYKLRMKSQVLKKYYTYNSIRLKMTQRALNWYRNNNTIMRQNSRRLYNQHRRILKKYTVRQSHQFAVIHRNLFMNNLNRFRQIIQEGPDYVCLSCRLALFRNQVVPFVEQKYIKQNMSDEIKKSIQTYFNYSSSSQSNWICKLCSDKIKKRQMPSRAVVNKLKLCDVPCELKKLNNLEKHLIALRLPFMKI
ncbi:unnamed protein product, partial [Rotaria sordida]